MARDIRPWIAAGLLSCAAAACATERAEEAARVQAGAAPVVPAAEATQPEPPPLAPAAAAAAALAATAADRAESLARLAIPARQAAAAAAAPGARWRLGPNGLPRNVRQTAEGYWIGAEPGLEHLAELHARGVRVVVSGTRLGRAARALFDELGMRHVDVPFGGRFPDADAIVEGTRDVPSSQIYIHCEHGGDRSGAMLAFLLTVRERWPATHALLAVVYPNPGHVRRLVELMDESGLDVADAELERFTGIYSPERNGGFGGMKVRGDSYEKLVRTTLRAMRSAGAL